MDDIRRPQHLKRRDYSVPARPAASQPHAPAYHQPHPHALPQEQPDHHPNPPAHQQYYQAQPVPAPAHHPAPAPSPAHQPVPAHTLTHTSHHQPEHLQPLPQNTHAPAKAKKIRLSGRLATIIIAVIIACAAIFGAGYLLKGSNDSKGIPASITRQVNYDLYFPSPMPNGYTYMKDTATFQIGQVFYKFANGKKRVTVNEQPMSDPKPDLNKLAGYVKFQSPVGPAAIGTDVGEPTAVVLTPSTVITMHTIGGATAKDLQTAIKNLKNIGQKQNQ